MVSPIGCPHVTFAPLAYPLTAILLHFHSPEDVFQVLYCLVSPLSLSISNCDVLIIFCLHSCVHAIHTLWRRRAQRRPETLLFWLN